MKSNKIENEDTVDSTTLSEHTSYKICDMFTHANKQNCKKEFFYFF